jgi:isopenicillin N synthase-like dioxygenase
VEIPIIDFGPYLASQPGALESTARAMGQACVTIGFFFAANHGISSRLIAQTFSEAERFHTLPLERKMDVRVLDKMPVGYLPLGHQTQRTSVYGKSTHPDSSASFYVRQEFAADHPDRLAGKPWVFENRWPKDLPGFRENVLAFFSAMSDLAMKLLPLYSAALGLAPNYMSSHEAFRPPVYNLRLLCYPPQKQKVEGEYGIGPHTDYGFCTLLAQTEVPGLEILTPSGEWIQAPALEGHLLINNADMCRRWTNDRFRSAPHRAFNTSAKTRYSIPFFVGPRLDVPLACLPTCHDASNPPRYAPISFGEHLAVINRANYDLPSEEEASGIPG